MLMFDHGKNFVNNQEEEVSNDKVIIKSVT